MIHAWHVHLERTALPCKSAAWLSVGLPVLMMPMAFGMPSVCSSTPNPGYARNRAPVLPATCARPCTLHGLWGNILCRHWPYPRSLRLLFTLCQMSKPTEQCCPIWPLLALQGPAQQRPPTCQRAVDAWPGRQVGTWRMRDGSSGQRQLPFLAAIPSSPPLRRLHGIMRGSLHLLRLINNASRAGC